MPFLDTRAPEAPPTPAYTAESIPKLVETVRQDRYVPSSDAYQSKMVFSAFLPALCALADLAESGAAARNFFARTCDLPLSLEIKDFTPEIEAKVGEWKVVARVPPKDLDIVITQLRKLGIEAVGVYSSPQTGQRDAAEYAWICSSNFDDVTLMTAAPPKQAALVHTVLLELALPAPGVSLTPANTSPRKPVETVSN